MGKLNPQAMVTVVQRLACGESQRSVAKLVGVSQQHISRLANREEVKRRIEQERLRLVDAVPDAVQNVIDLVVGMKDIPKHEIGRLKLAYNATRDVLKSVGLMPIQAFNVHNDRPQQAILPEVLEILQRHAVNSESEV